MRESRRAGAAPVCYRINVTTLHTPAVLAEPVIDVDSGGAVSFSATASGPSFRYTPDNYEA